VRELTVATVKGIRNLLVSFGYKTSLLKEKEAIDHIVDLFVPLDDDQAVKCVKYLTAIYLPRLVGDEEPEMPDFLTEASTLFAGTYGKFILSRLRGRGEGTDPVRHRKRDPEHGVSRRQLSLAMSILQLKRYLPPLPKKLRMKAKESCRERLTTPGRTPSRLLDEIRRTANELFPRGWDRKIPVPSFCVSNSSCFEASRASGGAQSYQFDEGAGCACRHTQILRDKTCCDPKMSDYIPPTHPNARSQADFTLWCCVSQPPALWAEMEIVEDPLKARVITKCNINCSCLKCLQKMIHGVLREHGAFELVGTPLTEEIISRIVRFPGSKWVSGDYEAATDNFHSDATDEGLNTILGNMTGPLSRNHEFMLLAKRSLTGLWIFDTDVGAFQMQRGQLMGSLLSFPILCLVNFAIWRHSAELSYGVACDGLGMGGEQDHVLINGDDIGFAATEDHYDLWKSLTPQVGLKPSMGKNYFASEFITLNTQLYTWVDDYGMKLVPFLNQGLLLPAGGWEAKPNGGEPSIDSLGPMHDLFVSGAQDRCVASAIFISHHKEELKTTWRNLFGPSRLGGLGAHPVRENHVYASSEGYSVRQLVVAELLRKAEIPRPVAGISQVYANYQHAYLRHKFPNSVRATEENLPDPPVDFRWESITPLVDEANISYRAMMSWLRPACGYERVSRQWENRVRSKADRMMKKWCPRISIPLETYLNYTMEEEVWVLTRNAGSDDGEEGDMDCFDQSCG
jgi:hypothetical protein